MKKHTHGTQSNSLNPYREELLKRKQELMVSLGINTKRLVDLQRASEDELMMVSQDEFLQLGLNRVFYGELLEVESALDLLDLGKYGTCAACGAPISPRRLQAVPWARYCVDCQDAAADKDLNKSAA